MSPIPPSAGRKGAVYERRRRQLLAENDVCWLCGHPGADTLDHHPPRSWLIQHGLDPNDPQFHHPAHGVKGCPVCRRACNSRKHKKLRVRQQQRGSRDW